MVGRGGGIEKGSKWETGKCALPLLLMQNLIMRIGGTSPHQVTHHSKWGHNWLQKIRQILLVYSTPSLASPCHGGMRRPEKQH